MLHASQGCQLTKIVSGNIELVRQEICCRYEGLITRDMQEKTIYEKIGRRLKEDEDLQGDLLGL